MKTYECDSCDRQKTTFKKSSNSGHDIPLSWITIQLKTYENDTLSDDKKIIYTGLPNELHFCCKECMIKYFFKTA